MSPNNGYTEKSKKIIHKYIVKYTLKHNNSVKFSVGNVVKIYK